MVSFFFPIWFRKNNNNGKACQVHHMLCMHCLFWFRISSLEDITGEVQRSKHELAYLAFEATPLMLKVPNMSGLHPIWVWTYTIQMLLHMQSPIFYRKIQHALALRNFFLGIICNYGSFHSNQNYRR
jgi:hypothetical protein